MQIDTLVNEYLQAQTLQILPQKAFNDVISNFVSAKDSTGIEDFVNESLKTQLRDIMNIGEAGDEDIDPYIEAIRQKQENTFIAKTKAEKKKRLLPRPADWDSDKEGEWEDNEEAYRPASPKVQKQSSRIASDDDEDEVVAAPAKKAAAKRAPAKKAAAKKTPAPKKAPAKATGRGRKKVVEPSEDEEEDE